MLGKSFILAGLMMMVTAPAMAATTQNNSASYTPKIEETAPLTDLLENNKFKTAYSAGYYSKSASSDPNNPEGIYPIQFTEWHYGYTDYALYFYVWNQTEYKGFDLFSNLNGVTLQELETGSYTMFPIKYISKTNDQFYKFKIDIKGLTIFTYLNDEGLRSYSLGQLHLKKKVSETGLATAYSFNKKYTYDGNVKNEDLTMSQENLEILNVNVKSGTYQTQTGDLDVFRHTDLHYVYFNIPNEYLEEYGDVAEYHFSYHPISLAPIAALQGRKLTQSYIDNTNSPSDIPSFENDKANYLGQYQWLNDNSVDYWRNNNHEYGFVMEYLYEGSLGASGVMASKTLTICSAMLAIGLAPITYGFSLFGLMGTTAMAAETELLKAQQWGYLHDLYLNNDANYIAIDDAYDDVSSKTLDNFINLDTLYDYSAYKIDNKLKEIYPTFEAYFNAAYVEEHLRYDQSNYELKTFKADRYSYSKDGITLPSEDSAWDEFIEDGESIKPIEEITSSNRETDIEVWKLETGTETEFNNNYIQAVTSNKTPYIFRFAPTPSYVYPIFRSDANVSGVLELAVNSCARAGTLYIGSGIYDLISLDLTFTKNGVETIMPICANPININPVINHAEASEDLEENIWDLIRKILISVLIFVGVVAALWLFLKIIGWTRKAFKD